MCVYRNGWTVTDESGFELKEEKTKIILFKAKQIFFLKNKFVSGFKQCGFNRQTNISNMLPCAQELKEKKVIKELMQLLHLFYWHEYTDEY